MVVELKKGADKAAMEEIMKKLNQRRPRKGLNASKYGGTVKFDEDGLVLQKRLRDEWE